MWPDETLQRHPRDFDIPMGFWEQTAHERSTKEQLSMEERESVKLEECAQNAKPRPMGHQQIP